MGRTHDLWYHIIEKEISLNIQWAADKIIFQYKIHLNYLRSLLLSSHIYGKEFLVRLQIRRRLGFWQCMDLPASEAPPTKAHQLHHVNQRAHTISTKLHSQNSPLLTQMNLLLLNLQNINVKFSGLVSWKNVFITLEIQISRQFSGRLREKAGFAFWFSSSCICVSVGIAYTFTCRGGADKIDEDIRLQDFLSIQNKPNECISLEHFIR